MKNMIYLVLNIILLIFNENQRTNIYFISTSSFFSKVTNNAINNSSIHFLETEFYGNDLRINLED